MSSPGWDLQKAVYAALAASETLNLLLGAERIYDATPQAAAFPFLVIDQTQIRDWSTGTEQGAEHVLLLHVWSRNESKREAYEIADAARDVLDGAALSPDEHHLVNLRHQYSDLRRDEDGKTYHGVIRFRAVTEPLLVA
jgi:hypothetical protein